MDNQKMSLLFTAKLRSFEKLNDRFLKCRCYVMALGKNRNKSHFSKENVNKAFPSLAYVPVVGHLKSDENGTHYLGGHDVSLDISTLTLKDLCVPYGMVIPSEEPVYEDVDEPNGTKSTYLVADIILWIGRYPELADAMYSEDVYFGQSMEILFSNSAPLKEDPTYTDITEFTFDALCLLGKSDDDRFNVEPCFPSASVKPITYSLDKDEFTSLMQEMKEELSFCMNNKDTNQGGNMNEKELILQRYSKTVEDLDFNIDELSVEELEAKMVELFSEKPSEPIAFSATYQEKLKALRNAFPSEVVRDENGNYIEETHYYVSDFDDTYAYVEIDHYTADGYDSKYVRYSYVYDPTTLTATVSDEYVEMIRVWLTLDEKAALDKERASYEAIVTEYSEYKEAHLHDNAEFETLETFKLNKEADEKKAKINDVLSKFEAKIGKTAEFAALKDEAEKYELDNLEKECIYIVGLYAAGELVTPAVKSAIKFAVDEPTGDGDDPCISVIKKYLNK